MKNWEAIEKEIIDSVFAGHDAAEVEGSQDFEADGLLDSLTIVAILTLLMDANPGTDYLSIATAEDFRSLPAIQNLYEKALERV